MNEEICSINNKGKTVKNEWETDSNFLLASYIVLKKGNSFSIIYLLTCLNKDVSVLLQVIHIYLFSLHLQLT